MVQMYMAWIQCTQRHNWNSLICAHVKDASNTIRGMYSGMLASYPAELWLGDEGSNPGFKPYERSLNVRELPGRGCRVTVASSENQDAVRGADYAMATCRKLPFGLIPLSGHRPISCVPLVGQSILFRSR